MDFDSEVEFYYPPPDSPPPTSKKSSSEPKQWDWEKAFKEFDKKKRSPITDAMIRKSQDWNDKYPHFTLRTYQLTENVDYKGVVVLGIGSEFDKRNRSHDPEFSLRLPDVVIKLTTNEAVADSKFLSAITAKYVDEVQRTDMDLSKDRHVFLKGPEILIGSSEWQRAENMAFEDMYYLVDLHKYLRVPTGDFGFVTRYLCPEFLKLPTQVLHIKLKGIAIALDDPVALEIASDVVKTGAELTFRFEQDDQIYRDRCDYVGYVLRCLELEEKLKAKLDQELYL